MMLRLTIAARITLIVLLSLVALWIVSIAHFYRARGDGLDLVRPPPAQIAALAALLERAPVPERAEVLASVNNPQLLARLDGTGAPPTPAGAVPAGAEMVDAYTAALRGRPVSIVELPPSGPVGLFPRLSRGRPNALEFRIGLSTGQVLIVDATAPVMLSRFGLPVGFGAGILGTIIAIVALIIMQREMKPLARLAAAVDRINPLTDPQPVPDAYRGPPEIRALINAFNRLQGRLAEMMRARMAMLGGISHDVRTFATRLRMRVDRIPDEGERARAVADIDDMIRLLDDALLTGRAGAGALNEELVEFEEIVREEVADRCGGGARIDLHSEIGPRRSTVLGDRLALRRVVANITDNAVKYGHAAHLGTAIKEGTIVLTVDDEGSGIPPAERERLLQPFTRLEPSRSRGTGGAGLGLAVARSLVEAHGGLLAIGDAPGKGARITVRLPLFAAT